MIGSSALRNVALSRFGTVWPYSRASGWYGRGESPAAALERAAGGRSGWQQVAVTCRDPGRDGTSQTKRKNSCSPHSGEVQLRDLSMRSLNEAQTKERSRVEAVLLPGVKVKLELFTVGGGDFYTQYKGKTGRKHGNVLVVRGRSKFRYRPCCPRIEA